MRIADASVYTHVNIGNKTVGILLADDHEMIERGGP